MMIPLLSAGSRMSQARLKCSILRTFLSSTPALWSNVFLSLSLSPTDSFSMSFCYRVSFFLSVVYPVPFLCFSGFPYFSCLLFSVISLCCCALPFPAVEQVVVHSIIEKLEIRWSFSLRKGFCLPAGPVQRVLVSFDDDSTSG